eukprot:CAMPEP_0182445682 /NCGR_PEP_ID=MMETSP1172-20130603/3724_1 /TAXON_ID=708627 /ORGANISM="Timspurckia oligopyrenoides, Strain CCMP3278" /LENGTH=638 /DNA_ID=CAMNT_0024641495 /DNA_START=74 /DNA_END=1990 /DNA_ORIENTATION=+
MSEWNCRGCDVGYAWSNSVLYLKYENSFLNRDKNVIRICGHVETSGKDVRMEYNGNGNSRSNQSRNVSNRNTDANGYKSVQNLRNNRSRFGQKSENRIDQNSFYGNKKRSDSTFQRSSQRSNYDRRSENYQETDRIPIQNPFVPRKASSLTENALDESSQKETLFGGLEIPDWIQSSLHEMGIESATDIQERCMESLFRGESLLINAETGSGKTLAFTLPLVLDLLRQLRLDSSNESNDQEQTSRHWYGLILAPSRELALQTWKTLETLLKFDKESRIRVSVLFEVSKSDSNERVELPADVASAHIVVATPRALFEQMDSSSTARNDLLTQVRCVVLDEADRMISAASKYARSREQMHAKRHLATKPAVQILDYLTDMDIRSSVFGDSRDQGLQVVAVSATMGRPFRRLLANVMHIQDMKLAPTFVRSETKATADIGDAIVTKSVTIPSGIRHIYLPVEDELPDFNQRSAVLHAAMMHAKVQNALVIIAENQSTASAIEALKSLGWKSAVPVHEAFGFLSGSFSRDAVLGKASQNKIENGSTTGSETAGLNAYPANVPVLVTSFGALRGLHFDGLQWVFLLGGAPSMEEYQHAAGRTGRCGTEGTIVSLVSWSEAKQLRSTQTALKIQLQKWRIEDIL